MRKEKYKLNLEYFIVPESKKMFVKPVETYEINIGASLKKLLVAKLGKY